MFEGEILLFRSEEANPAFEFNGWETHANKVNLVHFKGGHLSIARKKEYADMIGKEFLNQLDRVYTPSLQKS
ncbi:MAG: hypothetical protein IPJ37_13265 [Bacteroidales bacterium]|nr:hypothetical protein [Bacteroidales bacterium]